MENISAFAFYGSLRRGMENHALHENHLKYLFSARIAGYQLYSRGEFPVAIATSSTTDSIVVEVFKIEDASTRQVIHKLEMDEGYYLKLIEIDQQPVGIYLVDDKKNYKYVEDGDWVTFFRQKV